MPKVVAQSPIDTGDPAVDLLAAIVRRAVEDATKGSAEAEHFLNNFCLFIIFVPLFVDF